MGLPSVSAIESATLSNWPALQTAYDGSWVWRAARGHSNRANSINCLDPRDGDDAPLRVARLAELYVRNGLPPVFRITPLSAPPIEGALDALNWSRYGSSHVLAMAMPVHDTAPRHHTALFEPLDPDWHLTQAEMSGYDARTVDTLRLILAAIPTDSRGVLAYDQNGVPAAAVLASVSCGVATFVNVVAGASHRGQGFGRAAMTAALNWCRDAGATGAALQVAADNPVAIRLYSSLGFARAYDYVYRRPTVGP